MPRAVALVEALVRVCRAVLLAPPFLADPVVTFRRTDTEGCLPALTRRLREQTARCAVDFSLDLQDAGGTTRASHRTSACVKISRSAWTTSSTRTRRRL